MAAIGATRMCVVSAFTLLLTSLLCFPPAAAQDVQELPVLRFAVDHPGTAPYVYFDQRTGFYKGVIVDFFNSFKDQRSFEVEYIPTSRARRVKALQQGEADLFLTGEVWLDTDEPLLLTESLMPHNSYMYATNAFSAPFVPAQHPGETVCTRAGFVYPVLLEYFQKGGLTRLDSPSQEAMTQMLAKGRCDLAIMSAGNARAFMFAHKYCKVSFYQSPNVISKVDLVFALRAGLDQAQQEINQQLQHFIAVGHRDEALQRHLNEKSFPKLACE